MFFCVLTGFLKLRNKAQENNNLKEESECCNVLGNEYLKAGLFHVFAVELQLKLEKQESLNLTLILRKVY